MRDLEIRGAGNLLGDEQSGQVAAVGFEMYAQLLEEAVAELRGEPAAHAGAGAPRDPGHRLRAARLHRLRGDQDRRPPAHRPGAATARALDEVRAELTDRFGAPPEPVENLLALQAIRLKAAALRRHRRRLPRRPPAGRGPGARRRLGGAPCAPPTSEYVVLQAEARADAPTGVTKLHRSCAWVGSALDAILEARMSDPPSSRKRLSMKKLALVALALVLGLALLVAAGCGGNKVPQGAIATVGGVPSPRRSSTSTSIRPRRSAGRTASPLSRAPGRPPTTATPPRSSTTWSSSRSC